MSQPSELPHPLLRIVLVEPEIPQNTGNVGRTCVAVRSELHLIRPLGFEISDKNLKRAGLDYWPHLKWQIHDNYDAWWAQVTDPSRVFFFTTHTSRSYFEAKFQTGDWLVFGKETKGLESSLLQRNEPQLLTLPQYGPVRSLNLATAVAIASYEAIRQFHNPST